MPKHYPDGRPTVATPDAVAKAWNYANGAWEVQPYDKCPTIEGLAYFLDISVASVYNRQEFIEVIAAIKTRQAQVVIGKGLSGEFNSVIAKLLLSSKHGYVEKSATEADTRNINLDATELTDEQLDAKLGAITGSATRQEA